MESSANLRNIEEIPPNFRKIFSNYPCFNALQSQVLDDVFYSDNSLVVSAPTGSGKTALFELAIVRFLQSVQDETLLKQLKIIYVSPIKALCQERLLDWYKKFSDFGISCVCATGDSDNADLQSLRFNNLIITTPEKWDSLTRKWTDNKNIIQMVRLFMIDEVHLLNEENRGATLEVIVSRMKTIQNSMTSFEERDKSRIRFIALSATIPNIEDLSEWLKDHYPTKSFKFSEEMRPVRLEKIVYGYPYNPKTSSPFKFDITLNYKLPSLILQHSANKPTLIFCSTRKSVEMAARHIVQNLTINMNDQQKDKINGFISKISDVKIRETLKYGVGYHHAGLIVESRHLIEELFRSGDLPILVTTSTLALGVNLPAHLVIVKSTKCYGSAGFEDYPESMVLQMIGRAGRPQYDTSAVALILTSNFDKVKYERMIIGQTSIESNLHRHLIEHLNAEVALQTITDLDIALQWLMSTFFYIRARKNPKFYGFPMGLTTEKINAKLFEMCQIEVNKLIKWGMVVMDDKLEITSTDIGRAMAKYCIAFETMKLFTQITGQEILQQVLALISQCHEFSEMCLRVDDKKCLNMLNKKSNQQSIRFPLNGRIKTLDMKVNCIIQAVLGCLEIYDHSILSDSTKIMRNAERITKCLVEFLQIKNNCFQALLNAILLEKCFKAKLWENSKFVVKQLSGIGPVITSHLVNAGKTSFEAIRRSNPRDLEMIIKKKSPAGDKILKEVNGLPKFSLTLSHVKEEDGSVKVTLKIDLENVLDLQENCTLSPTSVMCLLVGDNKNNIFFHERFTQNYLMENPEVTKYFTISETNDLEAVFAHFLSEDWVGFDCNQTLDFVIKPMNRQSKEGGNKKTAPTYMQMFMDMYMKIRKNVGAPTKDNKPNKLVLNTTKKKTQIEKSVIEEEDQQKTIYTIKEPSGMIEDNKSIVEEFQDMSDLDEEELEKLEHEATVVINPEDLFIASEYSVTCKKSNSKEEQEEIAPKEASVTCKKSNSKKEQEEIAPKEPSPKIKEEKIVLEDPQLNLITRKYTKEATPLKTINKSPTNLKCNKTNAMLRYPSAMDLENDIVKDTKKEATLEDFRYAAKRKLSHNIDNQILPDSTLPNLLFAGSPPKDLPEEVQEPPKFLEDPSGSKSISWRTPLVYSPHYKFSPKIIESGNSLFSVPFDDRAGDSTLNSSYSPIGKLGQKTVSTPSTSGKGKGKANKSKFVLIDEEVPVKNLGKISDVCSNSFMENVGIRSGDTSLTSASDYYSDLLSLPMEAKQKEEVLKTPAVSSRNLAEASVPEEFRAQTPARTLQAPQAMYHQNPVMYPGPHILPPNYPPSPYHPYFNRPMYYPPPPPQYNYYPSPNYFIPPSPLPFVPQEPYYSEPLEPQKRLKLDPYMQHYSEASSSHYLPETLQETQEPNQFVINKYFSSLP